MATSSVSFSSINVTLARLQSVQEEFRSTLSALSTQVLQSINIQPVDSTGDLQDRVSECSDQDALSLAVSSEPEIEDLRDCVTQDNYDQLAEMFPAATKEEISEAFSCAIVYGNQRMMDFFLDKGASIYQHGEELEETPLRTAIVTNRDFAILLCRREREIRDEHALSYAISESDHELIRLIMVKSPHMPATQELLAKEVLKEEVPKARVSEQSIVKALMSGLKMYLMA